VSAKCTISDAGSRGNEEDLLPLSALQHYLFCPRQCALIHVERLWAENRFTAEGRLLHTRADAPVVERRKGVRTLTAVPIRSFRLGVHGVADVVEIREDEERMQVTPIEYKRGRPKAHRADEVQLCAQAMSLEEMCNIEIREGTLFYGETRRRSVVALDTELRRLTAEVAEAVRNLVGSGRTPAAVYDRRRCDSCSLLDLCRPKTLEHPADPGAYLLRAIDG
jgi:CRISPR-associated exonuclease Cas4